MRGRGRGANPNFFNQKNADNIVVGGPPARAGGGTTKFMEVALKKAKETGMLNLSGRQIKAFPPEVLKFNDLEGIIENWWEGNDITKLDLSNNEIPDVPEQIGEQ